MHSVNLSARLSVSRLVYGWWRLLGWDMNAQQIVGRLNECLELGITTHDHADIYGDYRVEEAFGAALKISPALRDNIQLVSKCGIRLVSPGRPQHRRKAYDTSTAHLIRSAEQSLRNLHTDHLDLLLVHRPSPIMDADAIAEAFNQLRISGKVREFGVSNFSPSQFDLLQSRLDFALVTNQLQISVLCHDAFHDGSLEQAQRLRHAPMAWSPLAGGKLFTEQSPRMDHIRAVMSNIAQVHHASLDQIALAWLLHHPARILPVVGSQSSERVRVAAHSTLIKLSNDEWFDIWEVAGGKIP